MMITVEDKVKEETYLLFDDMRSIAIVVLIFSLYSQQKENVVGFIPGDQSVT